MIPHDEAPEHEFEASPGLPEPLPAGEKMLWQGAPDWRLLAREALHTRWIMGYFGVLIAWRGANVLSDGGSLLDAGVAMLWPLPVAALALGLLLLIAWLMARTTVYTITDKRVVMRVGVVLSITFNLPLSQIEAAGLHTLADGSGDITLALAATDRIAYLHLWPHTRPWRLKRTEPMLRCLPQAAGVAATLAAALAASAGSAQGRLTPVQRPLRQTASGRSDQALAA
ncbi:MAG: photosynthetic complex putative assembly protein PuhB [Ideonella sp.]